MNKSIPTNAAHILKFIYRTETGKDAPECYDVVYGHNKTAKPLTRMTFDEVVAGGPDRTRRFGSSAAGAAQFMRDTLDKPKVAGDLKAEMGLTGSELFDADLQDRMAFHLLKRRGYEKFMSGKIGAVAFAKGLAQEWASFPVLAAVKGAHRQVARGETFYAGDKLNKALIKPEQVETLLREAKAMAGEVVRDDPVDATITDAATVTKVQTQLKALGYTEVGEVDGRVGKMTKTAILAFRNENDLPLVNYIDAAMLAALWTAKPRELAPSRADAAPAVVRDQVPEAKAAWWTKFSSWVAGGVSVAGATVSGVLDNLDGARGWLEPLKNTIGDVPVWVWFVILGAGAFFLWQKSRKAELAIQTAYQTGERR